MSFSPLSDRILVKRVEAEETSKGGIIIPDNAKEKPMHGTVVKTGPGKLSDTGTLKAVEVKEGQTIFFRKYAGTEVKIGGEDLLILREDEILAVVGA